MPCSRLHASLLRTTTVQCVMTWDWQAGPRPTYFWALQSGDTTGTRTQTSVDYSSRSHGIVVALVDCTRPTLNMQNTCPECGCGQVLYVYTYTKLTRPSNQVHVATGNGSQSSRTAVQRHIRWQKRRWEKLAIQAHQTKRASPAWGHDYNHL